MSSAEEGGGVVGAVSTDQTINNNSNNNNPLETIIQIPGADFTRSTSELRNLQSLDEAFDGDHLDPKGKRLIQRVPSTLRRHEEFRKYFKPKVISIGPLHHDDATLEESEKLKLKLAAHFIKKIGVDMDTLYNNMKAEMDDLKKCYDPKELETYSNDNEKLAWMFFVDGCAILQAIYTRCGTYDNFYAVYGQLFIKNDLLTFVYSALFLLENQISFRVLELLTSSGDGEKFMNAIIRFIDDTVINPAEMKEPQSHRPDRKTVEELSAHAGSTNISTISSSSENLCLPPITVDDSTMKLIAYEMCPDFKNDFTVTSYMCFLDLLIDEAEDIKDLRDAGIVYNGLRSDEEVAKLFNKMNTDLVPSPMIYGGVKRKIHNHCKKMWINHAAQAYHTYFRSPWTFLAFVGAITALLLGTLQTYYAIHQPK
ncbi:hypothetical protein ERO13_A11G308675v2 [Gossypium hirsutum]|nr:hypothetical protein ERO13_A11G308675v2 [Gossypium hirsutum]